MIDKKQLRDLIKATLIEVDLYSENAVSLLMGTAAVESGLGKYIRQINGPALGVFQMEPLTFRDHLEWIYRKGNSFSNNVFDKCNILEETDPEMLVYNLKAAIIFARVHYLRKPGEIPGTIDGMANYWKKWYNTPLGKGTPEKFVEAYKKYVL